MHESYNILKIKLGSFSYLLGVSRRFEARDEFQEVLRRVNLQVLDERDEDVVHLPTAMLQLGWNVYEFVIELTSLEFHTQNYRRYAIEVFKTKLHNLKISKGTIHFQENIG